jgi:hypothetical protein
MPEKPQNDPVTELLVMAFLDLIAERRLAGRAELAATQETIAQWISERTSLSVTARHVQELVKVLAQANLIEIGGAGIGKPNTYTTREDQMGSELFWTQVDALLLVWKHPARKALAVQ